MKLLHELVTEYAVLFPEKAAVEDANGKITYQELSARSASLAAALLARGFHTGDAAAVYVPFAKEIILGAVSILRAGGVYVPFDGNYPAQRLEYMLNDCEAKAVLTVRALWEKQPLRFPEEHVIFMDEAPETQACPVCPAVLSGDSPAMLLYTSGTTGNPKGVPHSHSFLLHLTDSNNIHEGAEMNADTRSGIVSAFPFVGTEGFLLTPLTKGGTTCIAPESAKKDIGILYQFLRQARITHIFLPSALAALLAEDYDIRGILIFAAGEKLRPFRSFAPGAFLINSYGSTETSAVFSKKIFSDDTHITVGKPSFSTKTLLTDEELHPVQPGEAGELLVSNPYMARAYWKLPELSKEKWIELNGERWFRTGDRARQTADGDYEILGRTDNMIKLRGFRIETGEVEAQITAAASRIGVPMGEHVVVKKTVGGTEHLCCYYEGKQEIDPSALTEEIAKYLADYMTPDYWVRLDALPRNVNGKVLRKELPEPKRKPISTGTLDNEIVARVVWTAAEVLESRELISPEDSFVSLGGTSLSAMVFVSRLRDQGIRIPAAQALSPKSLREIANGADIVWEQLWSPEEYEKVQSSFSQQGEHIQKVLPIAPWQDEMLFDQIIHPDWIGYKNVVMLQLDSVISQAHLREALDILSAENEELRSAIVYHDVTTVQQVITDRKIPLKMIEASSFGKQEMDDLRSRILNTPMNLQFSSLMRVIAVHARQETYLYVMTHCIAFTVEKRRAYLARMMSALETWYPSDASISGWREVLEAAKAKKPSGNQAAGKEIPAAAGNKNTPPDLCVYSEGKGPRLVFVHTGNTGSETYYQLANRLKDQAAFSVIEPYNLYHPDQAQYGIEKIAAKYIEILKRHQPQGPYLLGGWCYGGVVAHEMACQLERAGEEVRHLFLLDAHAIGSQELAALSESMYADVNREYFEICPLFSELRANGMLDAMVTNAAHVSQDLMRHAPSIYHGQVTYFKPEQIPAAASEDSRRYWETMMEYTAGNYEHYCDAGKLRVVSTPHEHDLMMDEESLDIIVPEILKAIERS